MSKNPDLDQVVAAWDDLPGHRHQVLVCRGPRCTARGAETTATALARALVEQGLGDDDVLVTQTGCLFPCNHAPVVAVQPDDVWYAGVDEALAARLVGEHLLHDPERFTVAVHLPGGPDERRTLRRRPAVRHAGRR